EAVELRPAEIAIGCSVVLAMAEQEITSGNERRRVARSHRDLPGNFPAGHSRKTKYAFSVDNKIPALLSRCDPFAGATERWDLLPAFASSSSRESGRVRWRQCCSPIWAPAFCAWIRPTQAASASNGRCVLI